jgi:hypothetical protein
VAWSVPVLAERDTRESIKLSNYGRCSFDARTIGPIHATSYKECTSKLGRTICIVRRAQWDQRGRHSLERNEQAWRDHLWCSVNARNKG